MSLRENIRVIKTHDPAARNWLEVVFLYPGFHAIIWYNVAHFFYRIKLKFIARLLSQIGKFFTGVEIHPGATIGKGLFIDHGSGIVIGETAEIGDYCTIYQGVTLGGTGKDSGKRHPTLGSHVFVGSGAKILGPFTIGNYAKIAANAVVLNEIPDNCTAVGVPARIVRQNGIKVDCDDKQFDNVHIPDPLTQEICKMQATIERLEEKISQLEEKQQDK